MVASLNMNQSRERAQIQLYFRLFPAFQLARDVGQILIQKSKSEIFVSSNQVFEPEF